MPVYGCGFGAMWSLRLRMGEDPATIGDTLMLLR
jgi:hypothetical protein